MAVTVTTSPQMVIELPTRLFSWPQLGMSIINRYDVSRDGTKFAEPLRGKPPAIF